MLLFEHPGKDNTARVLAVSLDKAQELACPIIIATTTGFTLQSLINLAQAKGLEQSIIAVSNVAGFKEKGSLSMPEDVRLAFEAKGIPVIRAAHALSAGERALSTDTGGIYPLEVAAKTLRMFGQGVKVGVEIAIMAMDTGLLPYGKPVVAIGGSAHGADAALVLTPSYTASMFDTKIHEILCKPRL